MLGTTASVKAAWLPVAVYQPGWATSASGCRCPGGFGTERKKRSRLTAAERRWSAMKVSVKVCPTPRETMPTGRAAPSPPPFKAASRRDLM